MMLERGLKIFMTGGVALLCAFIVFGNIHDPGTNLLFQLWKSDGTATGTVMVADIDPGSNNIPPRDLTNVNGTLYFTADDDVHGGELWKSDGTAAGTVMVADIGSPIGSDPQYLANVNGALYFRAGKSSMDSNCGSRTGPPPER